MGVEALRISVLGPISIEISGSVIPVHGRRQLGVLAVLVAARPEPLSADRLLDAVWPDAPDTSLNAVQYQVSRLRTLLDPQRRSADILSHGAGGYRLRVDRTAVDADRFADLARRGQEHLRSGAIPAAVAALEEASDLVQGRPYDGVDDLPDLAPEVARLTELITTATLDRLRAWQAVGRHAEVIVEARRQTAEYPWREAAWGLLATSLAAEGRQSEALDTLAAARRILADELGLDPGPELVDVQRAVLAQEIRPTTAARLQPLRVPIPVTELVGRVDLVATIGRLLADHRLLTVTGPGGVGKTRVGIAVADNWTDPIGYVELAPYDDAAVLVPLIADRLGAVGVHDLDGLVAAVSDRQLLLILDNGEHLIDDLAWLVPRLLAAPGLRVLITSREPLDVPAEMVVEVPPLDRQAAAELFTTRAATAAAGRGAPLDRELVHRICEELDRLPLALELAAARLRLLSMVELADGLDRRFELLADGHRGAPRHQQGLLHTVSWSVDAAPPQERQLLEIASVFPSSFDLAALSAVVATVAADGAAPAGTRGVVISQLAGLVRRSLITTLPDTSPRRYRLLLTIRAYARDRLTPTRWSLLQSAYLRHVRVTTRTLSRLAQGPAASAALADLRHSEPDQLAALTVARETGDGNTLLELVGALGWSWYRRANLGGIRWARLALDRTPTAPSSQRGPAWFTLGRLLYLSGDAVAAHDALHQAVRCGADDGVSDLQAHAAAWLAHLTTFTDQPRAGVAAAGEALELATRLDVESYVVAEATMVLGLAQRADGDLDQARATLRRAVDEAEDAQHSWAAVSSSWALMKADRDTGHLEEALAAATAMIDPLARDGDLSSWLVLMHTTAAVLAQDGQLHAAAELARELKQRMLLTGFDPELMDPLDGPAEAALIEMALAAPTAGDQTTSATGRLLIELLTRPW